jgi:hypothetical protein
MSEQERPPHYIRPEDTFGLTEHEQLWDRISDKRFRALVADEATTVLEVKESSNMYGDFLFVTLSRAVEGRQVALTFHGMGYHESREQWITKYWQWYDAIPLSPQKASQSIPKAEAERLIEERRLSIASMKTDEPPSDRAILFGLLADLTDEDGAYTELQDMDDLGLLGRGLLGDEDDE